MHELDLLAVVQGLLVVVLALEDVALGLLVLDDLEGVPDAGIRRRGGGDRVGLVLPGVGGLVVNVAGQSGARRGMADLHNVAEVDVAVRLDGRELDWGQCLVHALLEQVDLERPVGPLREVVLEDGLLHFEVLIPVPDAAFAVVLAGSLQLLLCVVLHGVLG